MDLSAALNSSKDVEFQDVYYSVSQRKNFVEIGKRNILNGVSGVFRNGQLTGIMGPSGAGKSSLLNAISGFRTCDVQGYIKINRKNSCYITQEDNHQALLTVEELMNIACALKIKSKSSYAQIISDILINLHLNHRRDVTSDKLSGGERKRLSIALELVANPAIFFLDEPTSGLDEVTAGQCIRLLRNLAQQGKTIVCTIHQPSANTFNCFDNLFVMARGNCVYQGGPSGIISYLSRANLVCPTHYSPSDYIIEVCDIDSNNISILSNLTQNGKLIYEPEPGTECDEQNNLGGYVSYCNRIDKSFKNAVTTLFMETPKSSSSVTCFGGSLLLEKMKAFSKKMHVDTHPVSSFTQFCVLLRLMMIKICRNRIALWIQFAHHVLCGLTFGLIFLKAANEGERMFDHLKYCVGCILVIVYTQVMVPVLSYPSDVKLVKKEFFNRWYTLTPYYLALTISRLPFQMLYNFIFLSLAYWLSGLPNEYWRFGLFFFVGCLTSFVAEGMGLAIGSMFSVTNGTAVGPLLIAPMMGLAVYGFDFAADIPIYIYALMKVSCIRVGAVTLVLTVFGFDRPELDCKGIYCHFSDPKVLLRFLRIENVSIWHEIGFLIILMVFFRVILFISLKKHCGT